jgi:hypothetical protein
MPDERDKKITKWQQTPRDQWLSSVESGSGQVIKETGAANNNRKISYRLLQPMGW